MSETEQSIVQVQLDESRKCLSCGFQSTVFYRLENEPEIEENEICGSCFASWLYDCDAEICMESIYFTE